jgi:hypothetical protein
MTQASKVKVVTGKVRFSYANVFVPKASVEGGTPKYSVSIIIPKSDTETVNKLKKAFEDCKTSSAAYFGGVVPKGLKGGLRDGDEEKDDAAYANSYFINANSANKPGIVDNDMQAIIDPSEFYSGCYGRASVTFYPYNAQGSKGIACGLNNLQKMEDGEPLGGASSAASDFAV